MLGISRDAVGVDSAQSGDMVIQVGRWWSLPRSKTENNRDWVRFTKYIRGFLEDFPRRVVEAIRDSTKTLLPQPRANSDGRKVFWYGHSGTCCIDECTIKALSRRSIGSEGMAVIQSDGRASK
jgi:hypothetical protein